MTQQQRLSVVIGASRGLGKHLATSAAARGHRVIACARDVQALDDLTIIAGGELTTWPGDFLSETAPLGPLADDIAAWEGPVSVIVTAATIGPVGPLVATDLVAWADALSQNVSGTARILARLLRVLGSDDLVVVFSGGGAGGPRPQPHVSAYTTSKTALGHLVEVVAREQPLGPVVVAIAPGAYPTGFTDAVAMADPALAGEDLLADVAKTRAMPFETGDLDAMMAYLESAPPVWLSGRTISAKRDRPSELEQQTAPGPDLFRLRRVDGVGVTVQEW